MAYILITSFYKGGAIILLIKLLTNKVFKIGSAKWGVIAGFSIWFLLQFVNLFLDEKGVQFEFIFFFAATIGKILIAISLFREPILFELMTKYKEQEKEFEKILETTFHELHLPTTQMELNLAVLAKADNSKGQRYKQLVSDFEMIKTIISNGQDAFKKQNNNNELTENKEDVTVINLNRIIQKWSIALKHEFADPRVNFKITFGSNVHASGNEGEISQIISNLLKNAIEAYPEAREDKDIIVITGHLQDSETDKYTIPFVEIIDSANGIKHSEQEKIWEKGYSTRTDKMIKGQGLFVVKNLSFKNRIKVELFSNHIDETNYIKKVGTTFRLIFPNN